jgi:hypothetical protein
MTTSTIDMHSPEIGKLLEALAKAQAIMRGAVEDSSNPFFKSSYADLTSVWEACREPLTTNGLSIIQTIQVLNGTNCLVSILGHLSGQWIKSVLPINPSKPDLQALGSAITYCRRYALSALVGVCPIDDDGEQAMPKDRTETVKKKKEDDLPKVINFDLPADVFQKSLEIYIKESAEVSGRSRNAIIERANNNPEGFIEALRGWEEKQAAKNQLISG